MLDAFLTVTNLLVEQAKHDIPTHILGDAAASTTCQQSTAASTDPAASQHDVRGQNAQPVFKKKFKQTTTQLPPHEPAAKTQLATPGP